MPGGISKLLLLLKPKRRWMQFSLGTMLLVVALLCLWLADYVSPIRKLERQLNDPDEVERVIAAQRLGYMGPEARSATKSLLRAMKDGNADLRKKSVWALSRITRDPDLLLPFLTDTDNDVKIAAAEGILWAGGEPTKVYASLMASGRLDDSDATGMALAPDKSASVLPLLLDALGSESESRENQAFSGLTFLSQPAPTVVPALIDRLRHPCAEVRKAAAERLLFLSPAGRDALPALKAGLNDPDPEVAAAMAAALGAVDPHNNDYLHVLKKALRSGNAQLVAHVASYLYRLGPAVAEASDDLVAGFCDPRVCNEPYYGFITIWAPALIRLGPRAIDPVERNLKQALASQKRLQALPNARREELKTIGRAAIRIMSSTLACFEAQPDGPPQSGQLAGTFRHKLREAIVRMLENMLDQVAILTMPETRGQTVFCLGCISPPSRSLPTMIAALEDYTDGAWFRYSAINVLGRIGKDASPAAGRLLDLLETDDEDLRHSVFEALANIGASDEAVRERLRLFRSSGDVTEQADAARALAASGEPAHEIVPTLITLAVNPHFGHGGEPTDEPWFSVHTYDELLESIASIRSAGIPDLEAALRSDNPYVRRAAAEALGKIGPEARGTVPRLIELLDDGRCWDAAAEALGGIGPEGYLATRRLVEMLAKPHGPPNTDVDGDNPDEDDLSDYDGSPMVPILHALRGIGPGAREALPGVLRLSNSADPDVKHAAIMALASIDPADRSLIGRLRNLLAEWERKSAVYNDEIHYRDDNYCLPEEGLGQIAEAIWRLGDRAEGLVPDLRRMVGAPLLDAEVRFCAAVALASFADGRQLAKESLKHMPLPDRHGLPKELLQRIDGLQLRGSWPMSPFAVP